MKVERKVMIMSTSERAIMGLLKELAKDFEDRVLVYIRLIATFDDGTHSGVQQRVVPRLQEELAAAPELDRRAAARDWFAGAMWECLSRHRGKGDWSGMTVGQLYDALGNEETEVYDALYDDGMSRTLDDAGRSAAIAECVDVACCALMLADRLRQDATP